MRAFQSIVPILFLVSQVAGAATIVGAGSDLTTGGAWRTSGVAKPLDGDGTNIYGSDGYLLTTSPVGSLPSYVLSIGNLGLDYYQGQNAGYSFVDNPTAAGSIRTGVWYQNSGNGVEDNLLLFTLSQNANFRLGVLVDTSGQMDISPSSLRLRQTVGGSANSGLIASNLGADLVADWYFFDVTGISGDQFVLSRVNWYNGGAQAFSNGVAGVTFDSIPEPATMGLMGLALAGLALRKYRRG